MSKALRHICEQLVIFYEHRVYGELLAPSSQYGNQVYNALCSQRSRTLETQRLSYSIFLKVKKCNGGMMNIYVVSSRNLITYFGPWRFTIIFHVNSTRFHITPHT